MKSQDEYKDVNNRVFVAANGRVEQNDEYGDMSLGRITEAERLCEELELSEVWAGGDMETVFKFAGEKQSRCLVEWAKNIPHFTELAIDDQVILMIYGLIFHELWTFFEVIGIWSRGLGLGLDNSSSTRG